VTVPPWAPPADLGLSKFEIAPEGVFVRIFEGRHRDPLGSRRPAAYRFGCPPGLPEDRQFGVVYLAEDLETAFLEAVVRERYVGVPGELVLALDEIRSKEVALVATRGPLRLLDLTGTSYVRLRLPRAALEGNDHLPSQTISAALHAHPEAPDGILYPSRFGGGRTSNIAVYDRAVARLRCVARVRLERMRGLAAIRRKHRIIVAK
jgi:hypothetical protein